MSNNKPQSTQADRADAHKLKMIRRRVRQRMRKANCVSPYINPTSDGPPFRSSK